MMHSVLSIGVQETDRKKADEILLKFWNQGDIDHQYTETRHHKDRPNEIIYWVELYCSEDIYIIEDEFRANGITLS